MRLPDDIEREIRIIEAEYDVRPGQHAGSAKLLDLRWAIERRIIVLKIYTGAIEDILTADDTSTLQGALAIATHAREESNKWLS